MTYHRANKYFLMGQESTQGTPVAATKDIGLVLDIQDIANREIIQSESISSLEVQQLHPGQEEYRKSLTIEFQHGRLLEYIFGTVGHAETTGDWKHTFTVASDSLSMTTESGNDSTTDIELVTAGVIVDSVEVNVALNATAQMRADLLGISEIPGGTASTAVLSTLTTFPQAKCHVTLDGVEATEVQEFSITMTKAPQQSFGLASNEAQQLHNTELKFVISGKLGFVGETIRDLFDDIDGFPIILNCHNDTALGSGRRELYISVQGTLLDNVTESASVGSLTFVDLSGEVLFNEAYSVDDISDVNWS